MRTFDVITFSIFGLMVGLPILLWVLAFVRDYRASKSLEDDPK